jgi:transposase InsO family protein
MSEPCHAIGPSDNGERHQLPVHRLCEIMNVSPRGYRSWRGRLMRENGIEVKRNKKFKATTDSNHSFNIAPNLLSRDFAADRPNQKWAEDISYIWTQEGWLYLAVILDLHSRRVIGLSWLCCANHCRLRAGPSAIA